MFSEKNMITSKKIKRKYIVCKKRKDFTEFYQKIKKKLCEKSVGVQLQS